MQNADQTTTQDLGAVTELLSGAFFQPFGRSTTHQLWSSAMVITPAMRGLFGVDVDALSRTITLQPHLPADWDNATLQRLHVGDSVSSLTYQRQDQSLVAKVTTNSGPQVRLKTSASNARTSADGLSIAFPLPPVEVSVPHGLPLPGARTAQMKVLAETASSRSLALELEAEAGSVVELKLRRNAPNLNLHAEGASITPAPHRGDPDALTVNFPSGSGYQHQTVIVRW